MKRFSEQFHKQASTVKLQAAERDALRARVISYMEYHPQKKTAAVASPATSGARLLATETFQTINVPIRMLFRASALLTVFMLIVIPVLAEQTMPGDSLYAVKVGFNEEVRGTIAFTPYQKIEWETERLNRRIAEAKQLATEGRLTETVEAEIAAAVKEHTEEVQKEIAVLRTEDTDQATLAAIELSTTLEIQTASLQETGTTLLATAVNDVAFEAEAQLVVDVMAASLAEQTSQNSEAPLPAYDKIMARVEQNTTRAFELLQSVGLSADDQLYKDIARRLEDVGRSIEQTKTLRNENETVASEQLLAVLERTQKIIVYMSDVDGNRSIALETIVPMILTPEEEQAQLAMLTADIERKSEILSLAQPKVSSGAAEKIAYSIDVAATNKTAAEAAPDATALSLVRESVVILDDALQIVAAEGVDIAASAPLETTSTTTSTSSVTEVPAEIE